jgi:hypothetical protein
MSAIDRRRFLALGAGAVAAAVLAACSRGSSSPSVDLGALSTLYPDAEGVAPVGKQAVKVKEIGNDRVALAAALSPTGSPAGLATSSADALRTHLTRAVADDFTKSRVVNVAGWQLPVTEARIAALLHLQH